MDKPKEMPTMIKHLPSVGCMLCILNIITCYIVTKVFAHVPAWLITPPISFLGNHQPEKTIYAILFTGAALCFFVSFFYVYEHSYKRGGLIVDSFCSKCLKAAMACAYLCPFFFAGQAIISLQKNALDDREHINVLSIIHVTSAGILFILAFMHTLLLLLVMRHVKDHKLSRASTRYKTVGFSMMLLAFLLMIALSLILKGVLMNSHVSTNLNGIVQYIFVLGMILVFYSYGCDFKYVAKEEVIAVYRVCSSNRVTI